MNTNVMNEVFFRTAKAEREGGKLSIDLKRVLSFMDGKSRSGELFKRAPPSLRNNWSELISELVKEGYIAPTPEANIDRKITPKELDPKDSSVRKSGDATSVHNLDYRKLSAAERVVAELEAAATAAANGLDYWKMSAAERVIAELEAAAAAANAKSDVQAKVEAKAKQQNDVVTHSTSAAKAKLDIEAKPEAGIQQKAENAAREAKLIAFFAAAREKAKAELKQLEQEAARAHAAVQAAATAAAKEKSVAEAKFNAEVKKKVQETARNYADLETAILASKTKSDVVAKSKSDVVAKAKSELKSKNEMHESDNPHLRDLEIENETLKKLLVEAYVEIAVLKATLGTKP